MAVINGTVIAVDLDTKVKKRDGGSYVGYRLTYRTADGEIKALEKTMKSLEFGAGPTILTTLKQLKAGDVFNAGLEKNDAGFLDVHSLSLGEGKDLPNEAPNAGPARGSTGNSRPVSTNTYETPEERKLKQRLIVRQAALNQALAFNQSQVEAGKMEDIQKNAEQFEEWVYRGL